MKCRYATETTANTTGSIQLIAINGFLVEIHIADVRFGLQATRETVDYLRMLDHQADKFSTSCGKTDYERRLKQATSNLDVFYEVLWIFHFSFIIYLNII